MNFEQLLEAKLSVVNRNKRIKDERIAFSKPEKTYAENEQKLKEEANKEISEMIENSDGLSKELIHQLLISDILSYRE